MEIIKMTGGPAAANMYILFNEGSHDAVIIDASCPAERVLSVLKEEQLRLRAILLTHGHFDHIMSADDLRKKTGASVYIHRNDDEMLEDPEKNLSLMMTGRPVKTSLSDEVAEDGDIINEAGLSLYVMHTPGHTRGSVCYIAEGELFSGDTLFHMGIGRTDLPGGSFEILENSLKKILTVEGDPTVLPGHGESTSLLFEKDNNPFMSML